MVGKWKVGRIARQVSAAFVLTGLIFAAADATADWPMARHDAKRTAGSPGSSNITTPTVFWRAYLGGRVAPTELIPFDIDGNGAQDFVYLEGGRLVARKATGDVIWKTPLLNLTSLYAVQDFDKDGKVEVLAGTSDHLMIFAGSDGSPLWTQPDGEMAVLAGVRIADVTGDGKPDLIAKECGCCGVTKSGPWTYAHSFAGGFSSSPPLWSADPIGCGAHAMALFDGNGDGQLELSDATDDAIEVLNATTGQVLASTPSLGSRLPSSTCLPANVDGVAGDELVCTQNVNQGPGLGGRRVLVLSYKSQPAPNLSVLWQHNVGDYDSGDLRVPPNLAFDLDGDGTAEITVSGKDASDVWTTYIYDGRTGALLTSIDGQEVAAVAPLQSIGGALVLTLSGKTLSAWSFVAKPTATATKKWSLANVAPVTFSNWSLGLVTDQSATLLSADWSGDGARDLLAIGDDTNGGKFLSSYSNINAAQPAKIGDYRLPSGVSPTAFWPVTGRTAATLRNDGLLVTLDNALKPAGSTESDGIRLGGYYSGSFGFGPTPILGAVGSDHAESVFAVDSRNALVRLDGKNATTAAPPKVSWSKLDTTAPVFVSQLDANLPGIVGNHKKDPIDQEVVALRADGSELWSSPVAGALPFDVMPGKVDADGVTDFFVQDTVSGVVTTRALSGRSGAVLWVSAPVTLAWGLQPMAIADWDGDGRTDVLTVPNTLQVLSGKTGLKIAENPDFLAYFMPLVTDFDADGTEEVIMQGGYFPVRNLHHDLITPVWVSSDDERPYPYGAIATCGSAQVLIEGSLTRPSRLTIRQASSGSTMSVVLAGGRKFSDEAEARGTMAFLGQLGDVSVEKDLTGQGRPSAVVGSTDGFLYALNPCTGDLDFAQNIGTPVGAPVFGDTDGDGKDEILITAADGYLYDIQHESLKAPAFVWDIDPDHGLSDGDVDDIVTIDTLWGKWGGVEGASSYEVAVVDLNGAYLMDPPWKDVGKAMDVNVPGLKLIDGKKYQFSVRSVGPNGKSHAAVSNGVNVHFRSTDAGADGSDDSKDGQVSDASSVSEAGADAGTEAGIPDSSFAAGGGCSCSTDPGAASPMWIGLSPLAIATLLVRRRDRQISAS